MNFVKPEVYVISYSDLNYLGIQDYLETIDCLDWFDNFIDDSGGKGLDLLPEIAGRLCYRSFKPGLNPNVTKIRTDSKKYLENILKKKHGSVLEHGSITFLFKNISRVFTHELVRHRAGCAISQESLRYVRLDNLDFVDPNLLFPNLDIIEQEQLENYIRNCEKFQKNLINLYITENMNFNDKKKLTSFFRRFAPLGLATSILWTANIRALRHIIPLRTSPGAEAEIRLIMGIVAEKCKEIASLCFQDLARSEDGHWQVNYEKV